MQESKDKSRVSPDQKTSVSSVGRWQLLLQMRAEATAIYNYAVTFNEMWKSNEQDEFMGIVSTVISNAIMLFTMRVHTAAEPIRKRLTDDSALLLKKSPEACLLLLWSGTTQATNIIKEGELELFLTQEPSRIPLLKCWLPRIQSCLERLRGLYQQCADAQATEFARDMDCLVQPAQKTLWQKLWSLSEEQSQMVQDETRGSLDYDQCKVVSFQDRKQAWEAYIKAFDKLPLASG